MTRLSSVNITASDSSVAIVKGQGIGVIYDNEPHIFIFDASQEYYGSTMTFTVILRVPYDQPVTMDFATVDGSAYAGVDYVATSGTLTFNPGETVATFTVELLALDPSPY